MNGRATATARSRQEGRPTTGSHPIHLLPVSENVLALYGISPETLLPGDGTPVVTRNKQQDRAWTEIVERLFRLIYAPERDFNAQLRESVYQIVIAAKRDTTTLDGAEIARLQSLEQEAWAIFMEVFLPIIRQAWIDVKKTPAGNLSEEQISDAESDFYCSVYHHLFLSEERLIHQYSPEQFPSLKHFVYHISVKLLTQ